jgi:hypothetical protein
MRRLLLARYVAAPVLAATFAGCGATPPQAPLPYAKKLDEATNNISTACGGAYQVTAFPGEHRQDLVTLEATASSAARKLALVYHRNASWVYQGETVGQIVGDADSMLAACGLGQAQAVLRRATR